MTIMNNAACSIDFMNHTITVSRKFLHESRRFGTPAFQQMLEITQTLPGFTLKIRQTLPSRRAFQPTYTQMTQLMSMMLPNPDEAIAELRKACSLYRNYAAVLRWFKNRYPELCEPDSYTFEQVAT